MSLGRIFGALKVPWVVSGTKNCKIPRVFMVFLKAGVTVFEASNGPLGLILVFLVNLFWILCKSAGPFCAPLLAFVDSYVGLC